MKEVVREGILWALPPPTAEWETFHRPASLEEAINLAEDHHRRPGREWLHLPIYDGALMAARQYGGPAGFMSSPQPLFPPRHTNSHGGY